MECIQYSTINTYNMKYIIQYYYYTIQYAVYDTIFSAVCYIQYNAAV